MPFTFQQLEIPDLVLIRPKVFPDSRGFFLESYKYSDFAANGIAEIFSQDNHSLSQKNVVRGLHYQLSPHAQGKLVRVIKGKVWDVAVDIRKDSPYYLEWQGVELSDENHHMLYVPPGFAHGFATLSEEAHLLYKCTSEYNFESERGIRYDDSKISIDWKVEMALLSHKDLELPCLE